MGHRTSRTNETTQLTDNREVNTWTTTDYNTWNTTQTYDIRDSHDQTTNVDVRDSRDQSTNIDVRDSRDQSTSLDYRDSRDLSTRVGDAAIVAGEGANVTTWNVTTDGGAVRGGFDLAGQLAQLFGDNLTRNTGRAFDLVDSTVATLSRDSAGAATKLGTGAFDLAGQLATLAGGTAGQATKLGTGAFDLVDGLVSTYTSGLAGATRDTTGRALQLAQDTNSGAFDLFSGTLKGLGAAYANAAQQTADAYADAQGRGAQTDKLLMLAVAGAMLVAVVAVRK